MGEATEPPKFFDVVVDLCRELAGSDIPLSPWPPIMPTLLTYADPLEATYFETSPVLPPVTAGTALTLNPAVQQWA